MSLYSTALADTICEFLASGKTLRATCRMLGMSERTVLDWRDRDEGPGFAAQYAAARAKGYEAMADEIADIADGRVPAMDGNDVPLMPDPQRDRLRVDSRKWLLAKALPKVYGDKVTAELTGKDGGPLAMLLGQLGKSALPVKGDE